MPTTLIVFVGRNKERLMDSISQLREVGFSRIVLVVGDDPKLPGEGEVMQVYRELDQDLKVFWNVSMAQITKRSVLDAANQILTLINVEKGLGNDVILNASYALRSLSISTYIAACMSRTKVVSSVPSYTGKNASRSETVEVPVLPIDYPGYEQQQLIIHIGKGVESLDTLIYMMFPDIDKDSKRFKSERSRLSHHLSRLEETGFITKSKKGRNISIRLTCLGEMLAQVIVRDDLRLDDFETKLTGTLAT